MKLGWSLLTLILGVVGVLAVLRAGERLAFGGGTDSISLSLVLGVVCIVGAWKSSRKARGS